MTGVYILQNQWQEEWVKKTSRGIGMSNNLGEKNQRTETLSEEERKRNKISFLRERIGI